VQAAMNVVNRVAERHNCVVVAFVVLNGDFNFDLVVLAAK
jgi:hypothetical protein